MRSLQYLLVPLTALSVAATPKPQDYASHATVNTSSGLFVPYITEPYSRVASFLDIPYAESPIGDLRFAAPVAKRHPGNKPVKATNLPAGCFQYMAPFLRGSIVDGPVTAASFQRGDSSNTTEDCLRLSVFAPKDEINRPGRSTRPVDRVPLPVVVWIHGGGFTSGGTNTPFQLAPNWVQRSQKHIVVQVQYRLNLLGLPNSAGLAEDGKNLNLPFLDQRLAVEWVHQNIAQFGGDPNRIVLWGESAGAYSVDGYLFAWHRDPIVKGVIANSGNAVAIPSVLSDANNHSVFSLVADRLGCGRMPPAEELKCMRQVPSSEIKSYLQADLGQGGAADDGIVFGAFADNVTVFANYTGRIGKDASNFPVQIPLLIGTNTDEGTVIVPYNFTNTNISTSLPSSLATIAKGFLLNLQCTTLQDVRLRSEAGATTFQYLYAGNFTNISPLPWLGAYHSSELPMIFGTYETEGPATDFQRQVSERMQDRYLDFVMDPAQGPSKGGWQPATAEPDHSQVLEWAADGNVERTISARALRDECLENGFSI